MEETKSPTTKPRRGTRKTKPFTDLSNTIPSSLPSSQSSSSLLKPPTKSSLSLPLKSLLNNNPNTNLNSNSKFTATQSTTNNNNHNDKKKEKKKGSSNKANPSSTLSPPPRTPSVSGNFQGFSDFFWVLIGFLNRFTTRNILLKKRKSKRKEIVELLSCCFEMRMPDLRKKKMEMVILVSPNHAQCHAKRQGREMAEVNAFKHDLPQDCIDKQRAYFAEVDAFELEEEVASADELE
ncbi:hypothetical protein CRYUN_Cryun09bG0131300 [Craigia yunnanensis]